MPGSRHRTVVELEDLRNRLREAEETLAAIRNGEVDSLIVSGPNGDQVFSLKGAEQPYRVFVEQMHEGAVTLTRDGTILYANRRFAQVVRSPLERVIGSRLQSFVRPADQAGLADVLCDDRPQTVRYVLSAGDGSLIPAQLSFQRLPVDDAVEAISLVVTDLTEQEEKRELVDALTGLRAAQEQLRRQNEELEAARAAAEAANHAKDEFLAALSHELRTPLTPVLMTAAALETSTDLAADVRADLRVLRRNVELEVRLIDDLLDLTRIARDKIELHLEVTDVHAVLDAALEISRDEMTAKGLELVRDLRAVRCHVHGDPVRIQQVLWNVIRNATKFTPPGGRVIVRTDGGDDGEASGTIRVSVADTGIGIGPDAIGKLFTPFEQADRSVTRQFGGLGLGLAISKRLAELHGGTITAHSEGRGKGATFTLTLPTAPVDAPAPGPDGHAPAGAAAAGAAKRLRILLVEDHHDTRRSMVRLLGRKHVVHAVDSVAAALHTAGRESLDLVISDLGLPDGSGLDLMRQLRERHGLTGICLTGFGAADDLARSADAGFRQHLTKPIDLRKLERAIDDVTR
jgi:PAS domain S-box-containing protein